MKLHYNLWIAFLLSCVVVGCKGLNPRSVATARQVLIPTQSVTLNSSTAERPRSPSNYRDVRIARKATSEASKNKLSSFDDSQAVIQTTATQVDSNQIPPSSSEVAWAEPIESYEDVANGATLEELLSLAFANNAAIKELAATTQIAAGYRTQVGLYANPLVGYQGQQLADAGADQHLIFVEQQIITGDKLQLNRAVLNEAVRAQLQELETQKLRVATDIKTAFFDCLRIQQQLSSIDQFSGLLQQGLIAAEKRMKAGEGSRIDLLQTQVQLKQLELDRRQLAVTLEARLREMAAIAGLPSLQLQSVSGQLPDSSASLDWKVIEEGLVTMSPEYAAAQARICQANALIRRHESQTLPNLAVQLGAGVDNSTDSGMINVQVGAPIPVFNKNQGNIAAARAEYCRAVQEAQRIDHAIRARLAVASGEYNRAEEAVKMYTAELLPAVQETLNLAEEAYQAGEQDFIQLLVTRRAYFDTNLASIAARAQLATVQAQIDGYMLSGGLNAVINNSGDDSLRGMSLDQQ